MDDVQGKARSPGLLGDPLSHVLESVRLRAMVPDMSKMTAPWGVMFGGMSPQAFREHVESLGLPHPPGDPPAVRGAFFVILHGGCWLELPAEGVRLQLTSGDVVLITRPDPHVLRDDPVSAVRHVSELISREHIEHRLGLRDGGGGEATIFLSGAFTFEDQEDHPLLGALPPVIDVRGVAGRPVAWLDETIKSLVHEVATDRPGTHSIVNHLTHVLFVQTVRDYFGRLPHDSGGSWLRALLDPEIGPVLGLMHRHPERSWTVASLASQALMSRSAFAARFVEVVGRPPLQYLTDCRMRKARELLRDARLGIKAVAARVGYANEFAFSTAFKRITGVCPSACRS